MGEKPTAADETAQRDITSAPETGSEQTVRGWDPTVKQPITGAGASEREVPREPGALETPNTRIRQIEPTKLEIPNL